VKFPTGGIAHEPQGMIRCDSEADSIVWMKEDNRYGFLCMHDFCSGILLFQSFIFKMMQQMTLIKKP